MKYKYLDNNPKACKTLLMIREVQLEELRELRALRPKSKDTIARIRKEQAIEIEIKALKNLIKRYEGGK